MGSGRRDKPNAGRACKPDEPTRQTRVCCARAASSHATAALPRRVMNLPPPHWASSQAEDQTLAYRRARGWALKAHCRALPLRLDRAPHRGPDRASSRRANRLLAWASFAISTGSPPAFRCRSPTPFLASELASFRPAFQSKPRNRLRAISGCTKSSSTASGSSPARTASGCGSTAVQAMT